MTLRAQAVSRVRREPRRIDQSLTGFDMRAAGAMTALAADTVLEECFCGKAIRRARFRVRRPACVTEEARAIDGVVQGHGRQVRVSWRHVPRARAGVVVDR